MDIFRLYFDDKWNILLHIHPIVFGLIILIPAYFLIKNRKWMLFSSNVEIESAEFGVGNHKMIIKPNYTNINIAYKLWVELSTRKIGIEIDFDNDVIIEIYKSWYQFFQITRELIKELPANKIRNDKDSKALVELSIHILNTGLRLHLTRWQAKYRKWHNEQNVCKEKTPQQLQQDFPDYEVLKTDMIKVNKQLIAYKHDVYQLAFGLEAKS